MRRNLFFALLAANLVFLAWSLWIAPGPDATPAAATQTAAAAPAAPAPAAPAATSCTSLGPFRDADAVAQAAGLLGAAGKRTQPRSESVQVSDGFWVFVAGRRDAAEQKAALLSLKRAGIEDAYALTDDPSLRIAVGLFPDRDRAEQRAQRVRNLKLDARVEEHFRADQRHWLDLQGETRETLAAPELARLGVTTPGLSTTACP